MQTGQEDIQLGAAEQLLRQGCLQQQADIITRLPELVRRFGGEALDRVVRMACTTLSGMQPLVQVIAIQTLSSMVGQMSTFSILDLFLLQLQRDITLHQTPSKVIEAWLHCLHTLDKQHRLSEPVLEDMLKRIHNQLTLDGTSDAVAIDMLQKLHSMAAVLKLWAVAHVANTMCTALSTCRPPVKAVAVRLLTSMLSLLDASGTLEQLLLHVQTQLPQEHLPEEVESAWLDCIKSLVQQERLPFDVLEAMLDDMCCYLTESSVTHEEVLMMFRKLGATSSVLSSQYVRHVFLPIAKGLAESSDKRPCIVGWCMLACASVHLPKEGAQQQCTSLGMQLFTAIDCMDHIVEILTCVGAAAGMQFVTQRVLGGMYPVLLAKQAGCQDRAAAVKTLTAAMSMGELPVATLRGKVLFHFGLLMSKDGWQNVRGFTCSVADNYLAILRKTCAIIDSDERVLPILQGFHRLASSELVDIATWSAAHCGAVVAVAGRNRYAPFIDMGVHVLAAHPTDSVRLLLAKSLPSIARHLTRAMCYEHVTRPLLQLLDDCCLEVRLQMLSALTETITNFCSDDGLDTVLTAPLLPVLHKVAEDSSCCLAIMSAFPHMVGALNISLGVSVHQSLLPIAMRGLGSDTSALRQAASKALVTVARQASSPDQQCELCKQLVRSHADPQVAKCNFLEGACCLLQGFSASFLRRNVWELCQVLSKDPDPEVRQKAGTLLPEVQACIRGASTGPVISAFPQPPQQHLSHGGPSNKSKPTSGIRAHPNAAWSIPAGPAPQRRQ